MVKMLAEETADWRTLGIMLKLKPDILDQIQANPGAATMQQSFENMLTAWMELTPEKRTWGILCEAVKTCDNNALAETLEDQGYDENSPGRYPS